MNPKECVHNTAYSVQLLYIAGLYLYRDQGTFVNRTLTCLHGRSLELTLIDSLIKHINLSKAAGEERILKSFKLYSVLLRGH